MKGNSFIFKVRWALIFLIISGISYSWFSTAGLSLLRLYERSNMGINWVPYNSSMETELGRENSKNRSEPNTAVRIEDSILSQDLIEDLLPGQNLIPHEQINQFEIPQFEPIQPKLIDVPEIPKFNFTAPQMLEPFEIPQPIDFQLIEPPKLIEMSRPLNLKPIKQYFP